MTLADRIIEVRASTGLGKKAFGKLFGVSHAAVDQWENGKTKSLKHHIVAEMEAKTGFCAIWINTGKGAKRVENHPGFVTERPTEYTSTDLKILEMLKKLPEEQKLRELAYLESEASRRD